MITIHQIDRLNAISHPQRLAILRRLMAASATLSQLGQALGVSPAHIRHHLLVLESAGLVELSATRPVRGFLEKYYRASAAAYFVSILITPQLSQNASAPVMASNDTALAQSTRAGIWPAGEAPVIVSQNSLDGLLRLREGLVSLTSCHLLDAETGEYNRPFILRLFPGEPMTLLRLFQRTQGLILPAGNPKGIRDIPDLVRPDVRMVNRESGSGNRLWLDAALDRLGLAPANINGYTQIATSHPALTTAIQRGDADTGLGLASSARDASLDFIPLFDEPYDLVAREDFWQSPSAAPLFDGFFSLAFRQAIRACPGYSLPDPSTQLQTIPSHLTHHRL